MQVLDYDPGVFDSLPDFFVARDDLDRLHEKIASLGDIVCSHGLHDVLGITLLHKHFDISPRERIVRRFQNNKLAVMRPEIGSDENLYAYVWCFGSGKDGRGFYPLEFCAYDVFRQERLARAHLLHLEKSKSFLRDFSNEIVGRDLHRTFGLAGLHARSLFHCDPGITLLELTDEQNRILTLETASEQHVKEIGNTTKTLWCFTPTREQILAASCATHCYGHCISHRSGRRVDYVN
jgi:hypothetical protein